MAGYAKSEKNLNASNEKDIKNKKKEKRDYDIKLGLEWTRGVYQRAMRKQDGGLIMCWRQHGPSPYISSSPFSKCPGD